MLTEKEIVSVLMANLNESLGFDSDELENNRTQAWDYYYNRPRGDEIAGRSQVQSSDVSDMVEAVLSNLAPILTNETLIQFEAAGEADEPQAQLESDFVAWMISGANQGYMQILSAVKDALLLRNGFIKVWVEKFDDERKYSREAISEFEIDGELERSNPSITVTVISVEDSETEGTFDVQFRERTHTRELRVEAIAPENMLYSPDLDSAYIGDAKFTAQRKFLTVSTLIGMGYPKEKVENAQSTTLDTKSDAQARKQDQKAQNLDDGGDKSQRMLETYDIFIEIDEEQNGRAELRHMHLVGVDLMLDELVDWIPLATGSPFIIPHRLYGQSIFDKLKQTQDSKTHSLRQWHDNMRRVNNARLAYNPLITTEDDVLDSRPGGGVRSKNPSEIVQIATNDMGASIAAALDYMDKQRGERAGASLDLQSSQMQLAGQVGNVGAERQISIREQLAGMMAGTLANTLIRETFLLAHRTLRAFIPGELTAKLNGKWVQTDPSQWPERTKVVVSTGLTQSEKGRRIAALTQVIQTQVGFIQQGQSGVITDPGGVFQALMDWSRASELENPEQYWTDPDSEQAQQAQQQKQQQQQQQQQAATEREDRIIAIEQKNNALEQLIKKYQADIDIQFKYDNAALDAEVEEAKIVGEATLDLERQQGEFQKSADEQEFKAAATDQVINQ